MVASAAFVPLPLSLSRSPSPSRDDRTNTHQSVGPHGGFPQCDTKHSSTLSPPTPPRQPAPEGPPPAPKGPPGPPPAPKLCQRHPHSRDSLHFLWLKIADLCSKSSSKVSCRRTHEKKLGKGGCGTRLRPEPYVPPTSVVM